MTTCEAEMQMTAGKNILLGRFYNIILKETAYAKWAEQNSDNGANKNSYWVVVSCGLLIMLLGLIVNFDSALLILTLNS